MRKFVHVSFTIIFLVVEMKLCSSSRTRHQKNIDLVRSISSSQSVEEGSSVELECNLGNVPDRAEVAWVKLKGLGEATFLATYRKEEGVTDYEEEFTSEMEKDGDEAVWSLTLYRVSKSMAGFYQCEVLLNDDPVSSRKVLLTVIDPSKVEHNTKYVISKQGGNVTLDCTDFEGEEVHWKRLGENSVVQSGKLLSLIRVDRSDSGVYVCSVSGGVRTMNISLLVEHIPIVSTSQAIISKSLGQPAHLTCEVTAVPVPAVSWYSLTSNEPTMIKSRGDLSISIQDYKGGKMTSRLIFHNMTLAQYGKYSCNATNTEGQASAVIQLIQPPPTSGGKRLCGRLPGLVMVLVSVLVRVSSSYTHGGV